MTRLVIVHELGRGLPKPHPLSPVGEHAVDADEMAPHVWPHVSWTFGLAGSMPRNKNATNKGPLWIHRPTRSSELKPETRFSTRSADGAPLRIDTGK